MSDHGSNVAFPWSDNTCSVKTSMNIILTIPGYGGRFDFFFFLSR